jgi:asparagine N-glycosylation enzyme membrane subunit Stt3
MSRRTAPTALALALCLVALLAYVPRTLPGLKRPLGPQSADGWFSIDPDGLYHTRRVERAFEEGLPVAGSDPYLDFPHGAAIPWPPYYDTFLYVVLAPFAPSEAQARRPWLERAVATLPIAFGIGSALFAACAAWWLTRSSTAAWQRAGVAAFAGVYAASGWGAIHYSRIGTGDHHAWIGMLHNASLLATTIAFGTSLRSRPRAIGWGVLCGMLAGLMMGSWVAALAYVGLAQLALGWLLVRRAQEELPGVAAFGLSYHLAALAVLFPAVLASPWKAELPWMVVNLSWFHVAWLALAALVFLPPALLDRGALSSARPAARAYPLVAAAVLALAAALLWLVQAAPARGVAEGLAWVSRADSFMDTVKESGPLVGPRAETAEDVFIALGIGVLLLPFVWFAAARRAFVQRIDEFLPWVIAAPVLLAQALLQKRFSDAAIVPLAVLLAWGLARWLHRSRAGVAIPIAIAFALVAHVSTARRVLPMLWRGPDPAWGGPFDALLGERTALDWLRERRTAANPTAVLAHWDRGHAIEWAADRPSVATNFGSYVGVDSYRDPARFFLQDDVRAAEALLLARQVGHVLVPASLGNYTASMCRIADLPSERFLSGPNAVTPLWQRTMLARLLEGGRGRDGTDSSLGFLRLVHATSRVNAAHRDARTSRPLPAAFVWERVTGAVLEWSGPPGERLEVLVEVELEPAAYKVTWRAAAEVGEDGIASVRVPYCTDGPNGDSVARRARWSAGGSERDLAVPERAVLEGARIALE